MREPQRRGKHQPADARSRNVEQQHELAGGAPPDVPRGDFDPAAADGLRSDRAPAQHPSEAAPGDVDGAASAGDECGEGGEGRVVDLAALHADDALIEALAAGTRPTPPRPGDALLATALAAWIAQSGGDRAEAEDTAEPNHPVVADAAQAAHAGRAADTAGAGDVADAGVVGAAAPSAAVVRADSTSDDSTPAATGTTRAPDAGIATTPDRAPARPPIRATLMRRLGAAAAITLVAMTAAVTVDAGGARPGDRLWPASKMLFAERAESLAAATAVEAGLDQVRTALREGRTADAVRELAAASAQLAVVRPAQGHDELAAQQQVLTVQLARDVAAPAAAGPPPAVVAAPTPEASSVPEQQATNESQPGTAAIPESERTPTPEPAPTPKPMPEPETTPTPQAEPETTPTPQAEPETTPTPQPEPSTELVPASAEAEPDTGGSGETTEPDAKAADPSEPASTDGNVPDPGADGSAGANRL